MRKQLRTGILVALVALSVVAGFANPAAAMTAQQETDDVAIVVEIPWDDTSVSDGDEATITVDNDIGDPLGSSNVTVRNSGDVATYWISYSEIGIEGSAQGLDVYTNDGSITTVKSVGYEGSETAQIADGESIEANVTANTFYADHPTTAEVSVISEDGTSTLGSKTVTVDSTNSTGYADISNLTVSGDSSNVTVQISSSSDFSDNPGYNGLSAISTSVIGATGGGGGGGGGGTDYQTLGIIVGAAAVLLLISRS